MSPHCRVLSKVLEYKFLHCDQAVHILFHDNSSLILHFHTPEIRTLFLRLLANLVPAAIEKSLGHRHELRRQNLRNQWAYFSTLSNFTFVSLLNLIGSRSLDDFSQYPVFPLVISKAEGDEVEWRDLGRPIGMVGDPNKTRLLSQKFGKADNFHNIPPYFYGSHYSSPATTFHFLLRIKPFDTGAKSIQNGRFDLPDRLFHSWDNVLDNIQKETSDVRECPPELYYQPLFLVNLNDLDFGVNQSGQRVDHVITPSLIGTCPFRFVFRLRQALESKRVSQNLAGWVDLIFGSSQLGPNAEVAHNVFFYLTYRHSKTKLDSARKRDQEALETQVFHFGQTPFQLTESPWPQRRCLDLSVVSNRFTKKYFVKKVFYEDLDVMVSTCEFCLQKVKPNGPVSEQGVPHVMFCATCRLCSECSNGHLKYTALWEDPYNFKSRARVDSGLQIVDQEKHLNLSASGRFQSEEERSRPRSQAISKGKASMQSDNSEDDELRKSSKSDPKAANKLGILDWQEQYVQKSERNLRNEIVKSQLDKGRMKSEDLTRSHFKNQNLSKKSGTSNRNDDSDDNDSHFGGGKVNLENFQTNQHKSIKFGSKTDFTLEIEEPLDILRNSQRLVRNLHSKPPLKSNNKAQPQVILEPSLDIFSKEPNQTPLKNLFQEDCEFCRQRGILETKSWKDNGAPHENAVLLIKEVSFMDLERKFISKVSILRPFKIDYYTFVLFKAQKGVLKKANLEMKTGEGPSQPKSGNQNGDKHGVRNDKTKCNQHHPRQYGGEPNQAFRAPPSGEKINPNRTPNPKTKTGPPFELNLTKSLSLEKLRIEMRKWGLLGMAHSLWTRIGTFELRNHAMILGGCCLGTLRVYSVKKNRLLYEQRLHRFMIEYISLSSQSKVITRDQTGVIIISRLNLRPTHSEPYFTPLFSVHQHFGASLSHLKFARLNGQIFLTVSRRPGAPPRLQIFDSEKGCAVLTDLTLEIDRFGAQANVPFHSKRRNPLSRNLPMSNHAQDPHTMHDTQARRRVSIQGGRGSLIYVNRRQSVPELRVNSRDFRVNLLNIQNKFKPERNREGLEVGSTKIHAETRLAFTGLGTILEFVDLSFGYLNCIVLVVRDDTKGEYVISTKTLEGVGLTTFCIKIKSKEHFLSSFMLFKDSLFQDHLACMNQKGTPVISYDSHLKVIQNTYSTSRT